jgi:hypothetical protein
VRQQITQGLTNQRKQILNAALLETAMNEAKIVNHLAANMLNNPSNLGCVRLAGAPSHVHAGAHSGSDASASLRSRRNQFACSVKPRASPK